MTAEKTIGRKLTKIDIQLSHVRLDKISIVTNMSIQNTFSKNQLKLTNNFNPKTDPNLYQKLTLRQKNDANPHQTPKVHPAGL
jgi:hypothetical protein